MGKEKKTLSNKQTRFEDFLINFSLGIYFVYHFIDFTFFPGDPSLRAIFFKIAFYLFFIVLSSHPQGGKQYKQAVRT